MDASDYSLCGILRQAHRNQLEGDVSSAAEILKWDVLEHLQKQRLQRNLHPAGGTGHGPVHNSKGGVPPPSQEKAKNSEAGRKPISDVNMFSSVPSDPAPKKPKQPFLRRGAGLNRFNMKLVKKQSPGKAIIATIPSKGRNPSRPRISSSRTSRTSASSVRTSASSRSLSPTISKRPASVRFEEEESSEDDDDDDDDHLVVDAERDVILENARQMKTARSEEAAIQAYLPPLEHGDPESEPLSIQEQLELQSTSDSVAQACNAQVRMSREKAEREEVDLAIFETLEHVADEVSFSSTSSVIHKLLRLGGSPQKDTSSGGDSSRFLSSLDVSPIRHHAAEEEDETPAMSARRSFKEIYGFSPSPDNRLEAVRPEERPSVEDEERSPTPDVQDAEDSSLASLHVRFSENVTHRSYELDDEGSRDSSMPKSDTDEESDGQVPALIKRSVDPPPCPRYRGGSEGAVGEAPQGESTFGRQTPLSELLDVGQLRKEVRHEQRDQSVRSLMSAPESLIHTRILELEQEIQTFKSENNRIGRLRKELEARLHSLEKDKAEFLHWKRTEERALQNRIRDIKQRTAKEKQGLEKHLHSERDYQLARKEAETLKGELEQAKAGFRVRESRLKGAEGKLRVELKGAKEELAQQKKANEALQKENSQLKYRVYRLQGKASAALMAQINRELAAAEEERKKAPPPPPETTPPAAEEAQKEGEEAKNPLAPEPPPLAPQDPVAPPGGVREVILTSSLPTVRVSNSAHEQTQPPIPVATVTTSSQPIATTHDASIEILEHRPAPSHPPTPKPRVSTSRNAVLSSPESSRNPPKGPQIPKERIESDGTIHRLYPDGKQETIFANGNRQILTPISGGKPGAFVRKIIFYNGDVEERHPDGKVDYFFSETLTKHTALADGREIVEFADGQTEFRFPDGSLEIRLADGSRRRVDAEGWTEIVLPNGTQVRMNKDNTQQELLFPNGQKELRTNGKKTLIYPNGTEKTVYPDGRQETRYANGRVRIKDREGNLIADVK